MTSKLTSRQVPGSRSLANALIAASTVALLLLAAGCESAGNGFLGADSPGTVELTVAPVPFDSVFYQVRLEWRYNGSAFLLSHFEYAVDPPVAGDTTWVRIAEKGATLLFKSSTPPESLDAIGPVISSDMHVFVIKAVTTHGIATPPIYRAFNSYTVAPQSRILTPVPSRVLDAETPTEFVVTWQGFDEDGITTKEPIRYKLRLDSLATLQSELGLGAGTPGPEDIQTFYSDFAPAFAGWHSVPAESTFAMISDVDPGTRYYFAVAAIDEAGAYEPRFLLDNNVLQFRPVAELALPVITIHNTFFYRRQAQGQFSLDERDVIHFTMPAGRPLPFNWFAEAPSSGAEITGYRWVLDPVNGNIFDETPRQDPGQTNRWSDWSLDETQVTLGPFTSVLPGEREPRFYLQARDNFGSISMVTVEIKSIEATFDKPLLVFDDFDGPPDRLVNLADPDGPLNNQPYGTFPTEAVLDTLMYAIGDVPYRFRPPGTLSQPGVFAGFDYDTLDYRFAPFEGLPLEILSRYQAVVWYLGIRDGSHRGKKFTTTTNVMAALRLGNTAGKINTLALYLSQGGKAWLFGDGVATAIANGYISRFGSFPFATFPYKSGGDGPSFQSILWPGNFLHDFLKIRSEMDMPISGFFETGLMDAIPYLPEFRSPGAPWPPFGWPGPRGEFDDPRVGPSSQRNLARWDGLPKLTITEEFPDWPLPLPAHLIAAYISLPNEILENRDGDVSTPVESRLDTLYLARRRRFRNISSSNEMDGKPVFFYYWGSDHGPVAWSAMPLWMFERTQLQKVTELILAEFGFTRKPDRRTWTGPGSVHDKLPRVVESIP